MKLKLTILVLWATLLCRTILPAATTCTAPVAKMVSVQGLVEVRRAGQTQWQPARMNDTYCGGDRIQVGRRSRADVSLVNQPVLRLDQDTTITFGGIREERTSLIEIIRGTLFFFSRLPRNLEIVTAFVNAGVEGTEGIVRVDSDRALISIFEGRVLASNAAGTLTLTTGQSAVAEQGRAPILTVLARPRDSVQWALYYLPTVSFNPADFQQAQPAIRESVEAYRQGDLETAFGRIQNVPDTIGDPRFFVYRASLLLAVGRFDEANGDIQRALQLNPNLSDAYALQTIIAIVQNERERGLEVARRATSADPKSSAALIALSYAQQANFDLEGARASLQKAVQVNPDDPLAWARLAEMSVSFGRLTEALDSANKAVAIEPNLSRTQTVLGFVYLTRVNTEEAKKAFERATELDQGDPLPHLGLGLAIIRDGDLLDGRKEIETAVSLDPNNAIMRSYLGKAYYEEKREKQAGDEYQIAKELDPKDPTPYFYDAILKQTTNRPVEALQDMEHAIDLNDNRAVYRSRLLLDSDLAARSAALGRIYSDLGFQQLALVEGWKSVNTDPTNFSAHRFLADSYSALPRHEIARVSELLQSQLLQPLNTTPIQPRLAESNLFLLSGQGPEGVSFNEFNPLFTRNGVNLQATGVAGQNSTYAGEGVASGIYKKGAFSLGGFHFQTGGFRKNADQNDDVGTSFLQLELSPETSIQAEYRYRNSVRGDIRLRFFPDDVFPAEKNREETQTGRFGFRHAFSPDSVVIGSFIYQSARFSSRENEVPQDPFFTFTDARRPETALSTEFQHIFRSEHLNLTTGLGYARSDGRVETTIGTILPPPFDVIALPNASTDLKHTNAYAYSDIKLLKSIIFTAGVSADFAHGDSPEFKSKHQFNPKVGITWNPFAATTVRAAAFRVLKRKLITNQTVEPTQVAGFNQFFDDNNGTDAWRYGGAIDQKFTENLFAGTEFSKRDMKSPFVTTDIFGNPVGKTQDMHEYLARNYVFWTPHPWIGLSAEYIFERFKTQGLTDQPRELDTHRVPIGIGFFHPSGLSVKLKGTYFNQHGRFVLINSDLRSGRGDFWTVDAGISYRLPNRYGFISVGATNLFDRKFKFFERDVNNPLIQPSRVVFGAITLALP